MSVSKYILDKGPEEFECHIRDTEEWPFVMDDPVFREIATDCALISIEELVSRRKRAFETHRVRVLNEPEEGEVGDDTSLDEQSADKQSVPDGFPEGEDKNPQTGHDMNIATGETKHGTPEIDKEDNVSKRLGAEEDSTGYRGRRPRSPNSHGGYSHRERSPSPGGRDP